MNGQMTLAGVNRRTLGLLCCGLWMALMASGCCCGPLACEDGCGIGCDEAPLHGCNEVAGRPIIHGPIDGLRVLRKQMVCGSGCGDVYYGEWRSTPPDACDPCCGDDYVGGAVPCRPFCWYPGKLLHALYGVRFCGDCGESYNDCGCDGGPLMMDTYAAQSSHPTRSRSVPTVAEPMEQRGRPVR